MSCAKLSIILKCTDAQKISDLLFFFPLSFDNDFSKIQMLRQNNND